MTEPDAESNTAVTYRDAGVDIDAGNRLVAAIKPLARATRRPPRQAVKENWWSAKDDPPSRCMSSAFTSDAGVLASST